MREMPHQALSPNKLYEQTRCRATGGWNYEVELQISKLVPCNDTQVVHTIAHGLTMHPLIPHHLLIATGDTSIIPLT